jgi:hypothetical protein
MRLPTSGGSPEQVLETPVDTAISFDCPTNRTSSCLVSRWGDGQLTFSFLDPVQGKDAVSTKLAQPGNLNWQVSPDGSRVAITSADQLREQVRILDLTKGTERNLQLPHGWLSGTSAGPKKVSPCLPPRNRPTI